MFTSLKPEIREQGKYKLSSDTLYIMGSISISPLYAWKAQASTTNLYYRNWVLSPKESLVTLKPIICLFTHRCPIKLHAWTPSCSTHLRQVHILVAVVLSLWIFLFALWDEIEIDFFHCICKGPKVNIYITTWFDFNGNSKNRETWSQW